MKYRRLLSLVITVILLIAAVPVAAEEHKFSINDGVLASYSGPGGEVVIPDGVTKIAWYAFNNKKNVTKIVVPDSVTEIGAYAFKNCDALTEITLPNSLKKLDEGLFYSCDSLARVDIPDSVTEIGNNVFTECTSLKAVTIPDSVTVIGHGAFVDCISLETLAVPDGVKHLDGKMFFGCSSLREINVSNGNESLTSVDGVLFNKDMSNIICYPEGRTQISYIIPASVKSISGYAFNGCKHLRALTLQNSLTELGYHELLCDNLETLNLPKNFKNLDPEVLVTCPKLENINVDNKNPNFASVGGVLYSSDGKTLKCCPPGRSGSFTVCDGVEVIGIGAFSACRNITQVVLPEGVTTIMDKAFSGCCSLESVNLPNSLETIGENAFSNCTSLSSVTLPDGIKSISPFVFSFCSALNSIYIPDGVKRICEFAFSDTAISQFIIPEGVTTVEHMTFGVLGKECVVVIPKSVEVNMPYNVIPNQYAKVYCYEGSGIDEYCKKYDYPVIYMPESSIDGDANGDGRIDLSDVAEVMRFIEGWDNSFNVYRSDVTNDGMVNLSDVLLIMKCVAGWKVELK